MPCCSAYDAEAVTSPLARTAKKKTATKKTAAKTVAARAAAFGNDCNDHKCYNAVNFGKPCDDGKCKCDADGKPKKEHARPKCPHDPPRPFGK